MHFIICNESVRGTMWLNQVEGRAGEKGAKRCVKDVLSNYNRAPPRVYNWI